MNSNTVILHLSLIEGIGPAVVQAIMHSKPAACAWHELYTFMPSDFMAYGLTPAVAQALVVGLRDKQMLSREQELIDAYDIKVVTILDAEFPVLLQHIHMPPVLLYYQGYALSGHEKSIAFVGSRKADAYGKRAVDALVPPLVEHGWAIVSGGALGVDSMAHKVTIGCGGRTVAVLGSGLLDPYPMSNKQLFQDILDMGGTIVSAFPLRFAPHPGNFPARNRIISGLSHGTVVVQAARNSGARITANYALEQGREVFAVPGMIDSELSVGCHDLIQLGAKLVAQVDDIISEFDGVLNNAIVSNQQAFKVKPVLATDTVHEQKKIGFLPSKNSLVVSTLAPVAPTHMYEKNSMQAAIFDLCAHPQTVDDLAVELKCELMKLQFLLFDMQMDGVIKQNFTGQWIVK